MVSQIQRALRIYEYRIGKGIFPGRLSYQGHGSTKPIHPLPERNENEMIIPILGLT
jgi:outer membrane protein OmpA-like peptidoglycan-associated protein